MNIVQVGSHKGNDDLTQIIKNFKFEEISKLILIEPQKEFNEDLEKCYLGYNFSIENIVITSDKSKNKITFFSCLEDKNKEISSISKEHLFKHNQRNFIETEIECSTINDILLKYEIEHLDILFIDAEGFDEYIIKSIDFDIFNIDKIYYENLHVNNFELKSFLDSKNYKINENILTNGWTNEAIKKN